MWREIYRHLNFLVKISHFFCCAMKHARIFLHLEAVQWPPKANQFQSLSRIWITRKVSCSEPKPILNFRFFSLSKHQTLRTLHKFSGSDKISCRHRNEKCSLACKWNQAKLFEINLVQWKNHICMPCTTWRVDEKRRFFSLNMYSKRNKFQIIRCNNRKSDTSEMFCIKRSPKTPKPAQSVSQTA